MENQELAGAGAPAPPPVVKAIRPTIGRVVYYFAKDEVAANGIEIYDYSKPLDAHIVYVWSDTCVNLAGFGHDGKPFIRTSVAINAGGAEAGHSAWAEWMPYQVGQAAKHAAAA